MLHEKPRNDFMKIDGEAYALLMMQALLSEMQPGLLWRHE
jgi:hypothetical protein